MVYAFDITTPSPVSNPFAPNYSMGSLISGIIGFIILIASILAFIFIVTGGISWITSGGDKAGIETARNRIINGIVGLIIVSAIWAIVRFIFPAVGLSFPDISFPSIGRGL